MTLEEIQVAAYDFQRIPDPDLPPADCLLWYMLRDIYDRYRNGVIGQAEGEQEKQKAMQLYRKNKADLEAAEAFLRFNAKMWQLTESARSNYRINRTLENADALAEAWDGAKARKDVISTE